MKLIILSAFEGRLQSSPIEWPNEPREIRMPVSPAPMGFHLGRDAEPPIIRVARFQVTSADTILLGGRIARVYELVDM